MHIKQSDVDDNGQSDETHRPGHEMLHGVDERPWHIAQHFPQLVDGVQTDQEDDKKTDKLDGDGAT